MAGARNLWRPADGDATGLRQARDAAVALKSCRIVRKENGAPGKTRTSNPQIRSLVLYPIELRARSREGHLAQAAWDRKCRDRPFAI